MQLYLSVSVPKLCTSNSVPIYLRKPFSPACQDLSPGEVVRLTYFPTTGLILSERIWSWTNWPKVRVTVGPFGISWTPHFGGLWEENVKSMKRLLAKQVDSIPLRYDELETVLINVEALLNSRPLEPVTSTDPDAIQLLTPGNFLIGRPLKALPTKDLSGRPLTYYRWWNLVQRLTDQLWDNWIATYQQSLCARQQLATSDCNYKVGDIVLLRDEQLCHREWLLAKVIATYPGDDHRVRVIELLCQGKLYKRGTGRLTLLLHNDEPPGSSPPGGCSGQTRAEEQPTMSEMAANDCQPPSLPTPGSREEINTNHS